MVKKNIIPKFGQSNFMLVSFLIEKEKKSHKFNATFSIIANTITNYIS